MKKTLILTLCLSLLLCLCACGGAAQPEPEQPPAQAADTPAPTEAPDYTIAQDAPAEPAREQEPAEEDAGLDTAAYEAAQACIGRSVEELYAAAGEPDSAQYAASCLEEGADDGMLYYGGFYVWTVRSDTSEIIHAVYLNE